MPSMVRKALFVMAALAAAAPAQTSTREEKIGRILDLSGSQAQMERVLDQFTQMLKNGFSKQFPNASPEQKEKAMAMQTKINGLVKSRVSWDKLRPEMVKAYAETFSDEEIEGLLNFYQSPAGQGFLHKMPLLTQKLMEMSQAQLVSLGPEIERLAKEQSQTAK